MISDFWKRELCSLCSASNQKDITLVFLFPVVNGKSHILLGQLTLSCLQLQQARAFHLQVVARELAVL